MKKTILLISILVLLTGCSGLYDPSNFILPDDSEFLALIQELENSEVICQYMKDNFSYKLNIFNPLNPYQLFLTKEGDCDDFSNFAVFFANWHGYGTWQIKIYHKYAVIKHFIAVYKENGKYNFSDGQYYIFREAINFKKIVEYDCCLQRKNWTKYIVYDYWNDIVETGYNN